MLSLLTDLEHPFQLIALIPVVIGFGAGLVMGRFRFKCALALSMILAPPALWTSWYWIESQSGCSGGDCTGPMIFMLFMAVPFLGIALFGVGMAAATFVELFRRKPKPA